MKYEIPKYEIDISDKNFPRENILKLSKIL